MNAALMFVLVVVLFVALFWLLFGNRPDEDLAQKALDLHDLLPVHCGHFPQIQLVLETDDHLFLQGRVPAKLARQWRTERREVVKLYLQGLRQDFRGLERLARLLAALSPEVKRKQEWEWIWLGGQFRLLYGFTQLQFAVHSLPPGNLLHLTETLTSLRMMLESTLNEMGGALPKLEGMLAS